VINISENVLATATGRGGKPGGTNPGSMGASSCSRRGGYSRIGGLGSGTERLGMPDELSETRSADVETVEQLFEKEEIVKGAAALQGTQRRNRRIRNRSSVMYVFCSSKSTSLLSQGRGQR